MAFGRLGPSTLERHPRLAPVEWTDHDDTCSPYLPAHKTVVIGLMGTRLGKEEKVGVLDGARGTAGLVEGDADRLRAVAALFLSFLAL